MPEIDSTIKAIMDVLGKLDSLMEDEYDEFSDNQSSTIYEKIYRRLLNSVDENFVDIEGRVIGIRGIALIPGTNPLSCEPTLLVCLFPVFHQLGESYPNDIMELRLNQTRRYLDACPSVKNVIFYGPVWDSALWKMHRDSFSRCNFYLKLFFTVYTRLKQKKR